MNGDVLVVRPFSAYGVPRHADAWKTRIVDHHYNGRGWRESRAALKHAMATITRRFHRYRKILHTAPPMSSDSAHRRLISRRGARRFNMAAYFAYRIT